MSRENPPIRRAGDATGQSSNVEALDREKAAELASALKGLAFPATKLEIQKHVSSKFSRDNAEILAEKINNLQDGVSYGSVSEVEKAVGLVRNTGS